MYDIYIRKLYVFLYIYIYYYIYLYLYIKIMHVLGSKLSLFSLYQRIVFNPIPRRFIYSLY